MEIIDFSLSIGNKTLIEKCNYKFKNGITHILGDNGVGKSMFSKACLGFIKFNGTILGNDSIVAISSNTNIPEDLNLSDVIQLLKHKFQMDKIKYLCDILRINGIEKKVKIKQLSDGQKQKIKLLSFLLPEYNVIILDEITNSLDKKTTHEIYDFLNNYCKSNNKTILNITHNLSDLEYVKGHYVLLRDKNITEINTKEDVIEMYLKG